MSIFSRGERIWLFALSALLIGLFTARAWISAGFAPTRLLDTPVYATAQSTPARVVTPSRANSETVIPEAVIPEAAIPKSTTTDLATAALSTSASKIAGASISEPIASTTAALSTSETYSTDPGISKPGTAELATPESTDPFPIDINTADETTLTLLPGIGPVIAERIVAYRTEHGLFQSIEGLLHVKGIGPARFERLVGLVTISLPEIR